MLPHPWLPIPLENGIDFGGELSPPLNEPVVHQPGEVGGEDVDGGRPPLPLVPAGVLEEGGEGAGELVVELETTRELSRRARRGSRPPGFRRRRDLPRRRRA